MIMEALKEYFLPYIISNIVFGLSVFLAIKKLIWTRIFFAAVFLWASYFNFSTGLRSPEIYLEYGRFTFVPFYRDFIYGYFSQNISMFIVPIAVGQFLIFLGLMLNGIWVKTACVGGIVFGLAISPLGVGAAFPATVLMAYAFYLLLKVENHDFIWHLNQYRFQKQ
jgi:hypothetical protein